MIIDFFMNDFLSSDTWLILSVAILGPTIGIWIRGLIVRKKKQNYSIVAICPHCRTNIGLEKIRNYICPECHKSVAFFDSLNRTNPKKKLLFECKQCGAENFRGLKFCPQCKIENP
jgi:DNA-directed RNA polymerase subunit RPC12/RpoP